MNRHKNTWDDIKTHEITWQRYQQENDLNRTKNSNYIYKIYRSGNTIFSFDDAYCQYHLDFKMCRDPHACSLVY